MRWCLGKVFVVACLVFGFFNYWVYLNGGRPPFLTLRDAVAGLNLQDVKTLRHSLPDFTLLNVSLPKVTFPKMALPSMGESLNSKNSNENSDAVVEVYKWVDAKGVINYAQKKPEGVNAQVLAVYRETNILQSQAKDIQKPQAPESKSAANVMPLSIEGSISPLQIKTVFDDAKKVKAQMEAHNKILEQILNSNVNNP